jgi:glycine dehydrogenase subunit 2
MAGYQVITVPSDEKGMVDIIALKDAVGDDTAGLMLTNPNTVGLFDWHITEITGIIKQAGGLCYYDGANLNAIMGITRPGDMGFDIVHVNLHKTFSTPHGGGGPGAGPVGCKSFLAEYLPSNNTVGIVHANTVGRVKAFYGNFLVIVKALAYILTLGKEGISQVAEQAVLNANYLMYLLAKDYEPAYKGFCMHEFVLTLENLKKETGVTAIDVAKSLLDHGIHPPTMYFPLIVHEALMVEPTETESKETLEEAAQIFIKVINEAKVDPDAMKRYPQSSCIGRPDEVAAARNPKLKYDYGF